MYDERTGKALMEIVKYPSAEAVTEAMKNDEPMLVLISFDGEKAIMSQIDVAISENMLLMKCGYKDTDIDKYFRIVLDKNGADWTFVCPPDYKNIPYKDKRIEAFYKDGFYVIPAVLFEIGYIVGINIPKRYLTDTYSLNNKKKSSFEILENLKLDLPENFDAENELKEALDAKYSCSD